jgi:hypothetical protein
LIVIGGCSKAINNFKR